MNIQTSLLKKFETLMGQNNTFLNLHASFERKVYRRILGPVYENEKENWRI
jgi:hypothetical protein